MELAKRLAPAFAKNELLSRSMQLYKRAETPKSAGLIIVAPGPFNSPVDHPAKQFVHLFLLRTPL